MQNPETPAEWQEAVNLADLFLSFDSARKYGLVVGGPDVDADRCDEILRAGKVRGYVPQPLEIERLMRRVVAELAAGGPDA